MFISCAIFLVHQIQQTISINSNILLRHKSVGFFIKIISLLFALDHSVNWSHPPTIFNHTTIQFGFQTLSWQSLLTFPFRIQSKHIQITFTVSKPYEEACSFFHTGTCNIVPKLCVSFGYKELFSTLQNDPLFLMQVTAEGSLVMTYCRNPLPLHKFLATLYISAYPISHLRNYKLRRGKKSGSDVTWPQS